MFRGEKLFEIITDLNLFPLNNGSSTRFSTPHSQSSAIDLSITNNISTLTSHWEVIQEPWGSDHFPIQIEFLGSAANYLRYNASSKIHSSKTDWNQVQLSFINSTPQCMELINNASLDVQTKYS